jgi:hypothetical protein
LIPLVILVFIDAHDAGTPLPIAIARAAEDALGVQTRVSIRTLPNDPTLAASTALIDAGRAEHAAAVARIAWADDRRSEARLEILATEGRPARSSTIAFDASDPIEERGRAIGLVLAALLAPEKQARLQQEKAARSEAAPALAAASAPPAPPSAPRHFALDAAAASGFAVDGVGSGMGGAIGLRWQPGKRIGARLGAQARFGEVSRALASTMDLAAAAGLVLFVVAPSEEHRLALAFRADALLLYESLSHLSQDDPEPVRGARLLPGATGLVEGQLALSPTLALMLSGGAELAFGRTDVFLHQEKVAELAPLRVVVQAGLVARF